MDDALKNLIREYVHMRVKNMQLRLQLETAIVTTSEKAI